MINLIFLMKNHLKAYYTDNTEENKNNLTKSLSAIFQSEDFDPDFLSSQISSEEEKNLLNLPKELKFDALESVPEETDWLYLHIFDMWICKNNWTLELDTERLTEREMKSLIETLANSKSRFHSLDLSSNRLTLSQISQLAEVLANPNCQLTSLSLSQNNIDDHRLKILLEGIIRIPSKLRILWLNSNNIGAKGGEALADALLHPNCRIEFLDVSYNNLDEDADKGVIAIANALTNIHCPLTKLRISWNVFGQAGIKSLAEALKNIYCRLTELNIAGNAIGFDGAREFMEALKENCTLIYSHTDFGNDPTRCGNHSYSVYKTLPPANENFREEQDEIKQQYLERNFRLKSAVTFIREILNSSSIEYSLETIKKLTEHLSVLSLEDRDFLEKTALYQHINAMINLNVKEDINPAPNFELSNSSLFPS